ncbi:hypothetical protein [Roseiconus lacunae]|uniref:hypothetical protein n=1 Tax=Roseiconus lacunae TaxID=2605694 RepID=UPI0011F176D4|nr:hypothetical protein [Roseiconus lacunae]
MRKNCPVCGKRVRVIDPRQDGRSTGASPWFSVHPDWRKFKTTCSGSNMTVETQLSRSLQKSGR